MHGTDFDQFSKWGISKARRNFQFSTENPEVWVIIGYPGPILTNILNQLPPMPESGYSRECHQNGGAAPGSWARLGKLGVERDGGGESGLELPLFLLLVIGFFESLVGLLLDPLTKFGTRARRPQ